MTERVIGTASERERIREILRKKGGEDRDAIVARRQEAEKTPPADEVIDTIPLFKVHKVKKIIDIGCGGGRNSLLLAKEIPEAEITALDKSRGALEAVSRRAREEKLENVHTLRGDARNIPAQDGTYDAAVSWRVLDEDSYMQMPERKDAIREMARVLKPGGDALVVLAFSKEQLDEVLELFKDAKLQPVSVALPAEIFVDFWVIKAKKKAEPLEGVETTAGVVKLEPYIKEHLVGLPGEQRTYDVWLERHGSPEKIGWVDFGYMKVREVSIESGTAYTALIENKIGDEERIAHIRIFTPFQDSKNIGELEGKGIGTAVLSMLLKEFESEGVVGASYHTKDERMQHVLEKVGFQKIGEYVYFKRFES